MISDKERVKAIVYNAEGLNMGFMNNADAKNTNCYDCKYKDGPRDIHMEDGSIKRFDGSLSFYCKGTDNKKRPNWKSAGPCEFYEYDENAVKIDT